MIYPHNLRIKATEVLVKALQLLSSSANLIESNNYLKFLEGKLSE